MKIKIERTIRMKNDKPTLSLHRLIHCRLICCMYILIDGLEQNKVVVSDHKNILHTYVLIFRNRRDILRILKSHFHVENHYLTVFRREATCFESQQSQL